MREASVTAGCSIEAGDCMGPCATCHAGCCRSFAVPITGADVLRIEREVGTPFGDFACRWADPNGKVARGFAPHLHFDDEPSTPFVLCLQHVPSEGHVGTTMCRFLVEGAPDSETPLGISNCGIYGSRPMTCRNFPLKFNSTGELAILHDVPQRGRKGDHPAYSLCPRPWTSDDVDALTAPQDLAIAKFEWEFFRTLARVWNQAPRSFAEFPEFLRLVYRNRVLEGHAAESVRSIGCDATAKQRAA